MTRVRIIEVEHIEPPEVDPPLWGGLTVGQAEQQYLERHFPNIVAVQKRKPKR